MGFFVNIKEGDIYFNPKISIIIAAYNQEKNIEKCLNSIVTQSYKNLEIIIINDGSTDNTNFICEDFFKYDKRIKLIYQNNGGLSRARNTGLKNMTGDYVTFVDADEKVRFYSEGPHRIFPRTKSVIGREVVNCHPPKSMHIVQQILDDFRSGARTQADFWIDMRGMKISIRYYALHDEQGKYLGCLEVTQDITELQQLTGQKRLLDELK